MAKTQVDPVCGMTIPEENLDNVPSSSYGGMTYYFCSQGHKEEFDEDPLMFLAEREMGEAEEKELAF